MRNKYWIRLALLLIIPAMLFTVSCSKKSVKDDGMSDAERAKQEELAKQRAIDEANIEAAKRAAMSAKAGKQRASFSMASTLRAPSDNSPRVRPPGPGPISSTSVPLRSPACRAILAVRFKSSRKFWPSDLRALSP